MDIYKAMIYFDEIYDKINDNEGMSLTVAVSTAKNR